MNNLEINNNDFENIKHIDEFGKEFWYARELMPLLGYSKWENFHKTIKRAIKSCENSNIRVSDHFPDIRKMVQTGDSKREILDYELSRYACYLIAQNGDSRKPVIANAQTYFAIQTRKQEITEQEYDSLSDDEKRFYQRKLTKQGNYILQKVALSAGVKNMAEFHNAGYRGLYNGENC